jgi:hypothetical protein
VYYRTMTNGTQKSLIHRTHNIRFRAGAKGSKLLFGNLHAHTFFACFEISLFFSADDVFWFGGGNAV